MSPILPRGGGAIRNIGETFTANPSNGTASLGIPLPVSPGRAGFSPQLSIAYDSGSGNGPFGLGWSLALPAISRKTEQQLPRYDDAIESDVFVLSGSEDLVPYLAKDAQGNWQPGTRQRDGFTVHRYRPRIEGLFARIERWVRQSDGDTHWRSITRDNITVFYGRTPESRIADPADPTRVFSWLVCSSYDDKGNAILYEYVPEDSDRIFENNQGQSSALAHERNRTDTSRSANRYLKRVRYGNAVPNRDGTGKVIDPATLTDWLFDLVFDYDDGHVTPSPSAGGLDFVNVTEDRAPGVSWPVRQDPFSTWRAGFEIRTYRLCHRVLMFHRFPEELGRDAYLARSMSFAYEQGPVVSYLTAVTEAGHVLRDTLQQPNRYLTRSFPSIDLEYSRIPTPAELAMLPVETVEGGGFDDIASGAAGGTAQWVDLDGEGAAGLLTEHDGAWLYRRNSSATNRPEGDEQRIVARFDAVQEVAERPSGGFQQGIATLMDLAGDGQVDLVTLGGGMSGFHERTDAYGWSPFRSFSSFPTTATDDPNVRMLDLNGDGLAEIVVTDDDAITWYPALGEEGFGPGLRVATAIDEERGPKLVFSDASASFYIADLSGDGTTDLVRIRNGSVCYWPNLGYGRFGAKVTMDNAPVFDSPDLFTQSRIELADLDGSGVADIVYLGSDGVRLFLNHAGNGWSEAIAVPQFPAIDSGTDVRVVDLLGSGTACLVWSTPNPTLAGRSMRYVDLMGGQKPHLLVGKRNNLGAEIRLRYVSSTTFYQADALAGQPWITRLSFPVHVLEHVETLDHLSGNRFVTRYAYHHGYFDGHEREFRGFGMVEQWDTEAFAVLPGAGAATISSNEEPASHVPPVLTRTWYHTGIVIGRGHVSDYFAGFRDAGDRGEYYREPASLNDNTEARRYLLDDTVLPGGLTPEEEQEACRALKGTMLHQEIYALDGTGSADYPHGYPFIVSERNFAIEILQPQLGQRHAVILSHPHETLEYQYDRIPHDPRIKHALVLEVDPASGNVLKELAIGYGRRETIHEVDAQGVVSEIPNPGLNALDPRDRARQTRTLITFTENGYTNAIDDPAQFPDDYRTPLQAETRTWELTGFQPENGNLRFSFDEWVRDGFALAASAIEIPYEQIATTTSRERRLVESVRARYRRDDLTAFLGSGQLEPMALPGESYRLALTPGLVADVYKRRRNAQPDEDLLPNPAPLIEGTGPDEGGFVAIDGNWWIPAGRVFFDPAANAQNPTATAAQELASARQHFFLPRKAVDPFGQSTVVAYDGPSNAAFPRYDLFVIRSTDALANTIEALNDYRVLLPKLVTDPNGNRTEVAFDALGLVVATALMGKAGESLGDLVDGLDLDPNLATRQAVIGNPQAQAAALLGKATTRIVYDLDLFRRSGQPPMAATLSRETHLHDPGGAQTRIQVKFGYTDGFGRKLQDKMQAEPGSAPQRQPPIALPGGDLQPGPLVLDPQGAVVPANTTSRWVGSGRTVYNNKGKPVRRYEPFFSATHLYEPEPEMTDTGVSPILFYDPIERVVATLHPHHTYEKVVFAPWRQATFDQSDTVAPNGTETGDPRTDPDIAGLVRAYFESQPVTWQTWFAQRSGNQLGAAEADAAQKASAHANTPAIAHLDALARPFLTIGRNRFERAGATVEEESATRVVWDIEGNQRAVEDALNRVVMRYDYDMLGRRIHQASMDAGERWLLNDIAGNPIRLWDSRGFLRRMAFDALRRPADLFVTENGAERLAERNVYGEAQGGAANHRTRVFQIFDGAGVVTHTAYDFKGNLTASRRDLLPTWDQVIDWSQNPVANDGSFTSQASFDALNRPVEAIAPDGSAYRHGFNEANLLDSVEVTFTGAAAATPVVTNLDYDARGQRERIAYGNGAATTCTYDPLTYRLVQMRSTRPATADTTASQLFQVPGVVQDLTYTYDPAGNITRIVDAAQKTVTHNGQQVDSKSAFTYDALYRLVEATGREHIGQTAFDFNPLAGERRDYPHAGAHANPNDMQTLRNYTERYQYDIAGNIDELRHIATGGGWTRSYVHDEDSLLEAGQKNNRLTRTTVGNGNAVAETYAYLDPVGHDVHGCMTALNGMAMSWDFKDQLHQVDLGGGGGAFYVYDAGGRRTRKVIASPGGTRRKERISLGFFEVYREFGGNGTTVSLERESLHVMDGQQRIALVETLTIENGAPVNAPAPLHRYQLANHLGTVSVELDGTGSLISFEECTPFGATSFQAGRSATEVNLKRYRYTGKERDDETGFCYFGARYYAPWLGVWSAPDPQQLIDGPNPYRYARNNPVRFYDPQGTDPDDAVKPEAEPPNPRGFKTFDEYKAATPKQTEEMARKLWDEAHKKKYLILYDKGNDEFKRQAEQAAKDHGVKAQSVAARKISDVITKEKPDVVMTFGHGISSEMSVGDGEWIGAPTLKRELKEAKQTQQITFVIQACSCGKKNGLADTLQADPDLSNYTFVSHVDIGHVTRNHDIRIANGTSLPAFLASKIEYQYTFDKKTAAKVVADVLAVKKDKETLPADKINTVIREVAVLGFDTFWDLLKSSSDVTKNPEVQALNLTPDALKRFSEGIDELRSRLNTSAAKYVKPPPLKHHVTEIR